MPPTLQQLVPDVDTLLNLDPEQLGILLLQVLHDRPQNSGKIHAGAYEGELLETSRGAYPREHEEKVREAVREAFAWLEGQALLIPADPIHREWKLLSRRGRRLLSKAGSDDFKAASLLPRQLLHPAIKDNVYFNFQRGDYPTAVYCAFRQVELSVAAASGLKGMNGTELMREAFKPVDLRKKDEEQVAGPLTDKSAEFPEQLARAHLFAGAFGNCRNPHSHKDIGLRAEDAVHMLVLASYLLRIVDTTGTTYPQKPD
jgi:uncharacterized protein (TIGR02391 family)